MLNLAKASSLRQNYPLNVLIFANTNCPLYRHSTMPMTNVALDTKRITNMELFSCQFTMIGLMRGQPWLISRMLYTVSRASCIWQNENGSCEAGPKTQNAVKFHRSNGSFPNPLNWWWIRFGCTALDQCYWNKENWFANWKSTMHFSDLHILASTMPLIIEFFVKIKSQFGRFWGQTRIIILSFP